ANKTVDEPLGHYAEGLACEPKVPELQSLQRPEEVPDPRTPQVAQEADPPLPGVPEVSEISGLPELDLESGDHHLSILEQLGRGVSGCRVHRCQSTLTPDRVLAGKVLPLGKATFPDMVEDFGKEVAMMRSLPSHAAIVGFHGACSTKRYEESGQRFKAYVMLLELCDMTLESLIRRRSEQQQPFDEAELLHVLKQVAAGLLHLHRHRVLHRDLKSANIWLCSAGSMGSEVTSLAVKIGDFDAAKVGSRAQTPVQTPHFMAPEVAAQPGEAYGPAADVWAFGCVVFEMLELGLPYGEDLTLPQLEAALVAGAGPPLSDRTAAESRAKGVVELMHKCLSKEAAARPTIEEVLNCLEALCRANGQAF
ncbi:kxcB, partial [Symbiodinium pilosum]